MSSPVDWVVLSQVIERHNARRRQEPCPEDAAYIRMLRKWAHHRIILRAPGLRLLQWTLSPEWTTPPTYTQPGPVSGEFEAR